MNRHGYARRVKIARACALSLALLSADCGVVHDQVANVRSAEHCDAAICGTTCNDPNGCGDNSCRDAAACHDACVGSACDAGCTDPAGCGPKDAGCTGPECKPQTDSGCTDAACMPATTACANRACNELKMRSSLCNSTTAPIALGDNCASSTSNPSFKFALCSKGGLVTQAPLQVDGDVSVDAREASFGANAKIDGVLLYAGTVDTSMLQATFVERTTPNCANPSELDVSTLVHSYASDNDNGSENLDKLRNFSGDMSVTLHCGRYYVAGLDGDGKLTLHVDGNVVLFVDGNVHLPSGFVVDAPDPARVTLVVNGEMDVNGLVVGDADADRHLLVIGTGRQLHFESGTNFIGGSLYAPSVELVNDANTPLQVNGVVFVGRAQINGMFTVHARRDALTAANSCGVP